MKKIRNGKAQYRAEINAIKQMVGEGQTGIYIYTKLIDEGKITLSYRQFLRYFAENSDKDKKVATGSRTTVRETSASTSPSRRNRRVLHDPTMTDERKKEIFG